MNRTVSATIFIQVVFTVSTLLMILMMLLHPPSRNGPHGDLARGLGLLLGAAYAILIFTVWNFLLYWFRAAYFNYVSPCIAGVLGLYLFTSALYPDFKPHYWSSVSIDNRTETRISFDNGHEYKGNIGHSGVNWGNEDTLVIGWWKGRQEDRPVQFQRILLKPTDAKRGDRLHIFIDERDKKIIFSCKSVGPNSAWASQGDTEGVEVVATDK